MANYYEDTMNDALVDSKQKAKIEEPPKYVYKPRLTTPNSNNPYYNTVANGGYSNAILGNYPEGADSSRRTGSSNPKLSVLRNCVGYAYGRFNEIANQGKMVYLSPVNAGDFMKYKGSCQSGWVPKLGACLVWKDSQGPGHVAIVEQINSDGTIVTSESEWNGSTFKTYTRSKGSDNNWIQGCSWMVKRAPRYTFQGFIYNPAVPDSAQPGLPLVDGGYEAPESTVTPAFSVDKLKSLIGNIFGFTKTETEQEQSVKTTVVYETVTEDVEVTKARSVDYDGILNQTKSTSLLTYPTNVESPFILLKVGNFVFGTYNSTNSNSKIFVDYPNFIRGLEVTKINGRLNQYAIQLVYQIQKGNDPNLIDRIFGSVGYGTVKISYGDWNAPTFIYKEEEAIITKLDSNVDFPNAKITYTLFCTSTALGLVSSSYTFQGGVFKPSDKIFEILFNSKYGLTGDTGVFYGMKSKSQVLSNGWIASNDKAVRVEAKENIDPLSYINYLVSCMVSNTNTGDDVLLDSSYYLSIIDDAYGEQGGPYFTIKQIYSNSKTIHNQDVYEVDVGFPTDALVMSFNIRDDNSWALLYNYSGNIQKEEYVYNIDNEGRVTTDYSPAYSTSTKNYITTPSQKTWWTNMTKFPISATLVIKGLIRPAMLMSYVKVNAFFYGQRHIASGLYFVTKQVDRVNGNGYRTELSLTRFAGDEDYIRSETESRSYQIAKVVDENGNTVSTHYSSSGRIHGGSGKEFDTSTTHQGESGRIHGGSGGLF